MSNENTPPEENSPEFTDLLAGLAKRPDGSMVAKRYRIEKHLGGGGMGDVYLVKDTELKDEYRALKLIKGQFVSNETDLKRFQNEVRLTSRLDHPNIVRVFEYGVDGGELYYTMQYVKGKSLRELLDDHDNKLPLDRALTILTELAKALEHAHAQKVIHRDLKPENIIIPDDGSPIKLTDFGLARSVEDDEERLTKLDSALGGTANYMSPEQAAESTDIDHRSDIYSFGILAYELATGKVPFEGLPGIVKHHHRETPIPSAKKQNRKLPGWFASIIEACTKKDREERYQSFEEIARVLGKQSYSFHWRSERNNLYAGAFALVIALIVGVLCLPTPKIPFSGIFNHKLQERVLDLMFNIRGVKSPPESLSIIIFDDESKYAYFSESNIKESWQRSHMAMLLEKLANASVDKVVFDINLRGLGDDSEQDQRLASALQLSPTYIARVEKYSLNKLDKTITTLNMDPHSLFRESSTNTFLANLKVVDNKVRRFKYGRGVADGITPMARIAYGGSASAGQTPGVLDYLNFYGPAGTIRTYSFKSVMDNDFDLQELRNNVVFISKQADLGLEGVPRDKFLTSFSKQYTPGAEIHATAYGNIVNQDWIRRFSLQHESIINAGIAGLLILNLLLLNRQKRLGLVLIGTLIWMICSLIAFNYLYIILPGITGILSAYIIVALQEIVNYYTRNNRDFPRS